MIKSSTSSKSSVHQQPRTVSDLSTYQFKVLTAESLKGNETILHEFIQSQLKAEYENSDSTLTITFEMVLHYIKSNVSFSSFIKLIESSAISYKDKIVEKVKSEIHFNQLPEKRKEKVVAEYYNRARNFIGKIGTQLYTFLKDYYVACKQNNFDNFFCQYRFMTNNTSILSVDLMKGVIDKVYKEDFILIEAQKRTGLLSIAQNGLLGSVLQNEEVKSSFKAGEFEKVHNLIQSKITAHGVHYSIPEKKKAHIHRMLRELTSEDNPFPSCEYEHSGTHIIADTVPSNTNKQQPKDKPPISVSNNSEGNVDLKHQMKLFISSMENFITRNPTVINSENNFLSEAMSCFRKYFSISEIQKAISSIESISMHQSAFLMEEDNIVSSPLTASKAQSDSKDMLCAAESDMNTTMQSGISSNSSSPWCAESADKDGYEILEGDGRADHELSDFFYRSCVFKNNGVRVINVISDIGGLDNQKKESSFLLSAILTILMHSISLLYLNEYRVADWKYHRQLIKVIQHLDKEFGSNAWAYDTVLRSLSLDPLNFNHQSIAGSTFDFGRCVENFITSDCLKKKGLRCIGSLDLDSCRDLNSIRSKIESLYQESLIKDSNKDTALTFVSIDSSSGKDKLSVKSLSHTLIVTANHTEICLQLFAAIYTTISGEMKVVLVTRSVDISVLDSDYFRYEYDIPTDIDNPPRLERVNFQGNSSDSKILTCITGGFRLSGLVYGQSLSQIATAKRNPHILARELRRMNDFAVSYGLDEMKILSSTSMWLRESIIDTIFGLVCQNFKSTTSQVALSTSFIHWVLENNSACAKKFGPKFDINDSSLNKIIHIPVNYPKRVHWMYILLHMPKKTIYYMDSIPSTMNGEFVANKLNVFLQSEFNTRQSCLGSECQQQPKSRRNGFVAWPIQHIPSPKQHDGDNCGVFTIMNMVRTTLKINENKYFTSAYNNKLTHENLTTVREIVKGIMFEAAPIDNLLKFVNDVYY